MSLKSECLHGFSKFNCVSLSRAQNGKNAVLNLKFGSEIHGCFIRHLVQILVRERGEGWVPSGYT